MGSDSMWRHVARIGAVSVEEINAAEGIVEATRERQQMGPARINGWLVVSRMLPWLAGDGCIPLTSPQQALL